MLLAGYLDKAVVIMRRQGTSLRGIGVLLSGTAVAQLIGVAATPLLTRLYSPEHFGTVAVFGAILSALAVPATLRYENAVHLPAKERLAAQVTIVAFWVAVIMGSGVLVLVSVLHPWIADATGIPEMARYAWLLPFGVMGAGVNAALTNWTIRQREFRPIARVNVTRALSQVAVQVALGLGGIGSVGLVVGRMVERLAGILPLWRLSARKYSREFSRVKPKNLLLLAHRYRDFPRLATPAALVETIREQLPTLLVAAFYGPLVAGFMAITGRVLMVPLTFLGNAVGQAYLSALPRHMRSGAGGYRLFMKTITSLFVAGLAMILIIGLASDILVFVLGGQWSGVQEYIVILGALYAVQFVSRPVTRTLDVLERQGVKIAGELVQLFVVGSTLTIGFLLGWGATSTLTLYVVCATATSVAVLEVTRRVLKRHAYTLRTRV